MVIDYIPPPPPPKRERSQFEGFVHGLSDDQREELAALLGAVMQDRDTRTEETA